LGFVQVIAVVKPFRARAVLAALEPLPIVVGTVREVMGFGRQKHRLHRYLGSEYSSSFVPKVEISVAVEESAVEEVLRAIVTNARTGRIGDGKIMILPSHPDHIEW
jgi:nitrogen regulatory protein P-II 1